MKLGSFLQPHLIIVKDSDPSYESVISRLIKEICKELSSDWTQKVENLIISRERENPTIFQGIALPHARIENFTDFIVAISIPKEPLYYKGEEIKIIFIILTGKTSKLYLNVLSAIAKFLENKVFFEKILSCNSAEEVIRVVEESGIKIKEDYTIKDIMNKDIITISPFSTLKEAIDTLASRRVHFLLVCDKKEPDDAFGEFLGVLTIKSIIDKKMPMLKNFVNLDFMKSFEIVEGILKDEDKILVQDVMAKPERIISPQHSIENTLFMMVRENIEFLPVVEGSKLVGIVAMDDFIRKIFRP